MITKEKLQELIKEEKTIYLKFKNQVLELKLNNKWYIDGCYLCKEVDWLKNAFAKHNLLDLYESEQAIEEERFETISSLKQEIKQLKQQLAEKDEEIEELEEEKEYIRRHKLLFEDALVNIAKANHEKISFAVEQLEKVKEIMSKSNESGYIIRFASMNDRDKFNETIDNQIKSIKEGK